MGGPTWLTAIFAAASLTVAVYCAGRLAAARRWHRPTELDTDGAHVVMGVAMAGMLVSGLRTLPARSGKSSSPRPRRGSATACSGPAAAPSRLPGAPPTPCRTWSSAPPWSSCS